MASPGSGGLLGGSWSSRRRRGAATTFGLTDRVVAFGIASSDASTLSGMLNEWTFGWPNSTYVLQADAMSVTLNGVAVALGVYDSTYLDISGVESGFHTLPISTGAFALSMQDATLQLNRKVVADATAFTLTRNAASLTTARRLAAAVQALTLTGQQTGLVAARRTTLGGTSFTLSTVAVTLLAQRRLAASSIAFDLAGVAATLTHRGINHTLLADPLEITLTGVETLLAHGYRLVFANGTYQLVPVDLRFARVLSGAVEDPIINLLNLSRQMTLEEGATPIVTLTPVTRTVTLE